MTKVLVIDDERSFRDGIVPEDTVVLYARTSVEGIEALESGLVWDQVWFDHDLGYREKLAEDDGRGLEEIGTKVCDETRPCARWMADPDNPIVTKNVFVHTMSPVGSGYLMGTLSPRYPSVRRLIARDYFIGGF